MRRQNVIHLPLFQETYTKIMNWRDSLEFPPEVPISRYLNLRYLMTFNNQPNVCRAARKTIKRFCDAASSRLLSSFHCHPIKVEIVLKTSPLRISGVNEVKKLPWFNTVDWEHIR